jgi:2,3-dihydroxy-2,3-dihydro-p-cumate dehydrogenase
MLGELIAVVTGSGGQIGTAIAERLASEGASVVLSDVNAGKMAETCEALKRLGAPDAIFVVADLSQEEGAQALHNATVAKFGRADILVNNAGGGIIRPFLEHTAETLRATIDRNLWTTIWCTRAFLPGMIEQKSGRVINIGADSVHTGTYSHAGYNAAKGGVHALQTGLAFEFGRHGVRFNTVSPGGVATPDLKLLLEDDPAKRAQYTMAVNPRAVMETIPNRRFAEMHEVAALVAFLASKDADAINGQVYSINGGQWML